MPTGFRQCRYSSPGGVVNETRHFLHLSLPDGLSGEYGLNSLQLRADCYINNLALTKSNNRSEKTIMLNRLLGLNHEASMQLYEQTDNGWAKKYWNHTIIGDLWVIRPDECPLGA